MRDLMLSLVPNVLVILVVLAVMWFTMWGPRRSFNRWARNSTQCVITSLDQDGDPRCARCLPDGGLERCWEK